MLNIAMTIDGKDAAAPTRLTVSNPANCCVLATVPDAGQQELDAAIDAARRAFPQWSARTIADRQAIIVQISSIIRNNADELARSLSSEQGKPLSAAAFEVESAALWTLATISYTVEPTVIEDTAEHRVETHHVPLGVVGAISPWNFPVLLSIWKIIPALLTGNTMVLKPSPFTPLTVLRLGELLRSVLPAGVLNIITGGDHLGPMMTAHPGFDKISFTGSTATGRRVMESAAPTLKRLTLELGGNDPAIIFPDVDPQKVAEQLFWSAFTNSGQVCAATKRAYIHDDIYDDVRDAMAVLAKSVKMGEASDQTSVVGPVQNGPQYRRIQSLIADCIDQGYPIIQGAIPQDHIGYFLPITLVDNPPEQSRIVQEEQFGPILPLLRFSDEDDVIARANASDYGLAATVWTADETRAVRVANQIEAGSVWINEALALSPFAAFGGHKQSGVGTENGLAGLLEYTNRKTITIQRKPNFLVKKI